MVVKATGVCKNMVHRLASEGEKCSAKCEIQFSVPKGRQAEWKNKIVVDNFKYWGCYKANNSLLLCCKGRGSTYKKIADRPERRWHYWLQFGVFI